MSKLFLEEFRNLTKTHFPQFKTLMNYVCNPFGKFFINFPIQIKKDHKGYGLYSSSRIPINSNIFMMSVTKCFTSYEYVDCSPSQIIKYNNLLNDIIISIQNTPTSQQLIKKYKILLQLIAHSYSPTMSLHQFTKYLLDDRIVNQPDLANQQNTNSQILYSLLKSSKITSKLINEKICNQLYGLKPEIIQKVFKIVSSRSIVLNQIILSPVIDLLNHQNQPNCTIEGVHLSHLQESFLVLKSLKNIKQGQQLTISYGNLSNYQLYFKYGFTLAQNKFSYFLLYVDFQQYNDYLTQIFQLKKKLFKAFGGLKQVIKLYRNQVDIESLRMLRIYFLTKNDILNNKNILDFSPIDFDIPINKDNQKMVNLFILENIQLYMAGSKNQKQENQKLQKIQKQQIQILILNEDRLRKVLEAS